MIIVKTKSDLDVALGPFRKKHIGFVPTMGALHAGHASLLKKSIAENDCTVLSIYINPTQFGPKEDFSKYPRTFEDDCKLAEAHKTDIVFAPTNEIIYPESFSTYIEETEVSKPLCGVFRPGHFRGVTTVVYRLLQLVKPNFVYFGQKDLQQCLVIQKMQHDLDLPVQIVICPTVREADGLAMSSRNRYLSPDDREKAALLYKILQQGEEQFKNGEKAANKIICVGKSLLASASGIQLQYLEIRSLPNLQAVDKITGPAAYFIAAYLGTTRLIDNAIFNAFLSPLQQYLRICIDKNDSTR